jgi:dGTPase
LEVSQISESIAYKVNEENEYFKNTNIDPKICAIAGLAHDLGHPPFGHNGEKALDDKMKSFGGFEGNAQTLRILSTLEKKQLKNRELLDLSVGVDDDGRDYRTGLNLTFRSLASVFKYDKKIPIVRDDKDSINKGYYHMDSDLIKEIKKNVCGNENKRNFKTVECCIMDVADDIAYSTYDIEDAFKGGFLHPLAIMSSERDLIERVRKEVNRRLKKRISNKKIVQTLFDLFRNSIFKTGESDHAITEENEPIYGAVKAYRISKDTADIGYLRTQLTSDLVTRFIAGITVELNDQFPALSKVDLDSDTKLLVEVLKVYSYEATIMSPKLKVTENRGYGIVGAIFDALSSPEGSLLLPDDFQALYGRATGKLEQMRVVCDFIAGMTDRYAVEFYSRITGANHQTIFKPL